MAKEHPVWVLDTCAIIDLKHLLPAVRQWGFFDRLRKLVQQGRVSFPIQVARELKGARHTDTPEAWALHVIQEVVFNRDPAHDVVRRVMAEAGDVVERDAETEKADPYVIAHALEIRARGREPVVVTKDVIDRIPLRIALSTACDRLGVPWMHVEEFVKKADAVDLDAEGGLF